MTYIAKLVKIICKDGSLPKWKTLDSLNEKTWPEDGKDCLIITHGLHRYFGKWIQKTQSFKVRYGWVPTDGYPIKYRESCSIDYPPEKGKCSEL